MNTRRHDFKSNLKKTASSFVLDTRTATSHFPGIGRYVVSLAQAMAPLLARDERLILLRDPSQPSPWNLTALAGERVQVVDVSVSPFSPLQQLMIPRLLRRLGADLYHSPYYLMPYRTGCPTLLTVHDLIPLLFPKHSTIQARLFFRWATALALRTAHRVIAVSEATRRDLLAHFRIPTRRVVTIPEAADQAFHRRPPDEAKAVRQEHDLPEQYILYLGSNKPHKNLARLIEAFSRITFHASRFTLVIAGVWDPRYPEARQRAESLALGKAVRFLGPVAERDLPALYSGATLFTFPSEYEGFGLPVLEAMACGTPVACSNISSLPEVVGDAALTFDPTNTNAIANALNRLLSDTDLRADLRERGLRQAAQFSWERTARDTLAVYRQTVRDTCPPGSTAYNNSI